MGHHELAREVYLVPGFSSPRAWRRSGRAVAYLRQVHQDLFSHFCLCFRKKSSFGPRRPRSTRPFRDISARRRGTFMRAQRPLCLWVAHSHAASLRRPVVVQDMTFMARARRCRHRKGRAGARPRSTSFCTSEGVDPDDVREVYLVPGFSSPRTWRRSDRIVPSLRPLPRPFFL